MSAPKEQGTRWERIVADYAARRGFPWDRAPLRGTRDLLDIQGCVLDGWLIGCKSLQRGKTLGIRLSEAMNEAQKAKRNLNGLLPARRGLAADVIPVQVLQRTGHLPGRAYVVMEYDDFLRLAEMRRDWAKEDQ